VAEVTYYWDNYGEGGSSTWGDPSYMIDGILTNYAYTANDGELAPLGETTSPGSNLGTISKVELRAYGYGDGDDRIDLSFNNEGSVGSPEYQLTVPASPGWSSYVDVTNDPSVDGWTWAKIKDLTAETSYYLFVEFDKSGKGNTMHCAKVEIRVTYTPSGGYYHGLKVHGIGELALCDVGTEQLRARKGSTTYGLELVDTSDPNASALRVQTPTGIKAARKYT